MKDQFNRLTIFWFVFTSLISIFCLGIYVWGGSEALGWQEVSELIPQTVPLFAESNPSVSSSIFLVRQHYLIQSISPAVWPSIIGAVIGLVGTIILIQGIQAWSKIHWRQFLLGIVIWFGIILWKNSSLPLQDWLSFLHGPWVALSCFSAVVLAVLSSSSIPSLLLETSHSSDLENSKKKWGAFMFFYLINLILSMGNLWGLWTSTLYIPAFILLEISFTLELFRSLRYENKLYQRLIIALFLLSHSLLLPFLFNNNEAGIRALETWLIMTHLCMTLLFPFFLWTNFKEPILKNLAIYKVVHKAHFIPIFLIQIGVFILSSSWVFARQGTAWHQIVAAYYNEQGDVEHFLGNKSLEEIAYKNAMIHSKLNAKSNVSLARMSQMVGDVEKQAYYLQTSQIKFPSEKNFVALANIYGNENQWFESLFTLKKAFQQFPQSPHIATQLSRAYEQLKQIDSAAYYLVLAKELALENPIYQANLLYFDVRYQSKLVSQQDVNDWSTSTDHALQANILAQSWNNKQRLSSNFPKESFEATPEVRDLALIYNTCLFFKSQAPLFPFDQWKKESTWVQKFPEITYLEAWQDYYHQQPLRALNQLDLLIQQANTTQAKEYQAVLSTWKQELVEKKVKIKIESLLQAKSALQSHPFTPGVLQQSLPFLHRANKHTEAYQASLAALQWNENLAIYYPIYIQEAFLQGEIQYADDAMNRLKKLDPSLFSSHEANFAKAREKALNRQKFN
ncbi:tetratricopeptide repeat protein [Aquirufa rosea]|uniref:Tetratricopeptide repeat protein n=1 Tax=Aquirufa rosea TaxID=2509241 RepID=A0A4Q1BYE1_9BACT|nr:hypothetical protein [Aquirufa rosea]RXK48112.1 hypothetical protein ESB04_08670 [Aquirufa rosea]